MTRGQFNAYHQRPFFIINIQSGQVIGLPRYNPVAKSEITRNNETGMVKSKFRIAGFIYNRYFTRVGGVIGKHVKHE